MTSQVASVVKNLPANAGDARDTGSLPGLGRSPGVGNGTPLQHSCLENSIGIGTWGSTVYGATKNQTRLSDRANTHTHTPFMHQDIAKNFMDIVSFVPHNNIGEGAIMSLRKKLIYTVRNSNVMIRILIVWSQSPCSLTSKIQYLPQM